MAFIDNISLCLAIIFFSSTFILSYTDLRGSFHAIRTIRFDEKNIYIKLFFLQNKVFDIQELKAIKEFKITKFMAKIKMLSNEKTGFFIEFKNGKKYRISQSIQDLEILKSNLINIIQKNEKYYVNS